MIPSNESNLDALDWLYEKFKLVVWADEPRDQVAANLLLGVLAAVSSTVTFGLTIALALIFAVFASIGLARLAYREAMENRNVVVGLLVVFALTALTALFAGLQAAVAVLVVGLAVVPVLSTFDII